MQLIVNQAQVWLYPRVVDFRKSIDGLGALILDQFDMNLKADIFIFLNRHRDKVKVLAWHGNGFVLIYKRLEKGKFTRSQLNEESSLLTLSDKELSWLLAGLNWEQMSHWKELDYDEFY